MGKKAEELGALQVSRLRKPGMNFVGGVDGLALLIAAGGSRSWILRYTLHGKRRDFGLGGFPDVPLAEARTQARDAKTLIRRGNDPIDEARRQRAKPPPVAVPLFGAYALGYVEQHRAGWKNEKHAAQWISTLTTYAFPTLAQLPVDMIETSHVVKVLKAIWNSKTETANRLRGRMQSVLDAATAEGYRKGENPARWQGHLENLLPAPERLRKRKHHSAMPIEAAPAFYARLAERSGVSAHALRFLMLTAARTNEVTGARDGEIAGDTWTIPAARMKSGRPHRVPLGDEALRVLAEVPRYVGSPFYFGSSRSIDRGLSNMAMLELMREMDAGAVPHGFRSTFRDWIAEKTDFPGEVAEMALAHVIKDGTEAAYRRGDLFEKRRAMMLAWEGFLLGK